MVQHPAVPVIGVLAQTHVGDHEKLGQLVLQRTDRPLNDAVVVEVLVADRILRGRDAEEQHPRRSLLPPPGARLLHCLIDGELADPGHRRNRIANILAVDDEQRVDEIGRGKHRLAHRRTEPRGVPEPAWPVAQRVGLESRLGIHDRYSGSTDRRNNYSAGQGPSCRNDLRGASRWRS